jgi:hypothetical protein
MGRDKKPSFGTRRREAEARVQALKLAEMAGKLEGPGAAARLDRVRGKFEAVTRRRWFWFRLRRKLGGVAQALLALWIVACLAVIVVFATANSLSVPPGVAVLHLASFPNCDAARAVGLAPAAHGGPGYWSRHDRDKDGTACEPWRR